ncbi:MAG: DUF302 domain-containing protein [Thiohalorhabdus sp.]|uniref:DUF302 domain-containing protein n=1 Tax=Thiohalorhabdus sp. TaxID=3094134 RepID=UPI003980EB81
MWDVNSFPATARAVMLVGLVFAFLTLAPQGEVAGQEETESPLYRVDLPPDRTLEEVEMSIQSKAEGLNLADVGTLDVAEGMQNRGIDFEQVYKVYQVCNLGLGAEVLKEVPAFGAFIPCKIVVFEEDDHLALITYLPSYALRYFPDAPPEAERIAEKIEQDIIEVMDAAEAGGF